MNRLISSRSKLNISLLTLVALVHAQANAHPGHGVFEQGLVHAITSPVHLALLASCGAALALSASLLRNPRYRLAMRCAGASAVVLAGALWLI
jgi:hypothetical protein